MTQPNKFYTKRNVFSSILGEFNLYMRIMLGIIKNVAPGITGH